ncbi:MAG TPA: two-component regulator propeller domain-containing protein [Puia sp.]|nr:two-component regulator propeller domain-containing protein [Puia sp.]
MKSNLILLMLVLCFVLPRLSAQSPEYQFSTLNFSNGLSNNHITSLYKDPRGFMWFGTMSGLDRYDGYEFKVFRHDQHDPHSIGDNYIEQIFEGPEGKMWVQSRSSRFNIYDLATERFDRDYAGYLRRHGLPEFWLLGITHSATGFWFVYRDSGIYHLNADGRVFAVRPDSTRPGCLSTAPVSDVKEDHAGNCWVFHQNGLLEKVDGRTHAVVTRTTEIEKVIGNNQVPCGLYIDNQDDIWLYSSGYFKGVWRYRPSTGEFIHFTADLSADLSAGALAKAEALAKAKASARPEASAKPEALAKAGVPPKPGRLSSNVIYSALQDEMGKIWLATDHGGVDILDKSNLTVTALTHIEDDRKSLAENSLPAMIRDSTGTIWLGTFKSGISYYHQNSVEFPLYRHHPRDPHSLSFDDVNKFVEDSAGNLWIGSNGGGLIYFDRRHNRFRQYVNDPANSNSPANNIIVSLLIDHENRLWIGTYFGGLDCFDGKRFIHYRHDDHRPASLADDRVMCLYEDSEHNIWAGTLAGGLDRFDRRRNGFEHFTSSQANSIRNNYVSSVLEDREHNLWIATAYGIDVMDKRTGRFTHYSSDSNQLSTDNVILLFRDSRDNMWVATRDGLNLFLPEKNAFQSFSTENGLPDNTIRGIVEDQDHELWVSTANGLSRIQVTSAGDRPGPVRIRCRNYHEKDGLQGREFNERTALSTRDGSLIFGGPNGFNLFRPSALTNIFAPPPIVLTGLDIFNRSVHVGEKIGNHVVLERSVSETPEITLSHSEDIFSIEFAALDFVDNSGDKYAYTLEGFNKNWLVTDGKARKATYTNLDAGTYTFKVKAADEDGNWYDRETSLKIVVLPPFWKTPLAYVVYVLSLIGILFIARRTIIRKARSRFALEQERRETKRLHEIDLMKIRFFTNMSHELRTPLSLILAPVDKLLTGPPVPDPHPQYEMIRRNARRLLHLVNQLLDFRKMEVNELRLNPRQGDILKFVREISWSFIDLAERKHIAFSYNADTRSLRTSFDHDKIERILFNLLSNAFKFTPARGEVSVEVTTEPEADKTILCIRVKDTGIGIAPEVREKIFDRFFQSEVPDTILNQGSGIGLAITQEFVRMHQGQLVVESELNKGSCFTIRLPFTPIPETAEVAYKPDPTAASTISDDAATNGATPKTAATAPAINGTPVLPAGALPKADPSPANGTPLATGAPPTILIVEDNEDFRFYLKDNLRHFYSIIEASDGKEGWRRALADHPDLIVSDISMPAMNGTELCKKISGDERTAQIPVILLTAMTGDGAELNGLRTGAIDYIIKPFDFELLLSRIRNILAHTATVRRTYQRQVQAIPAGVEVESADELFVKGVLEYIEKNMGNPDLSVGELSARFHASRSTFYKRLLLLTGKTPIEFIRHIRLRRAAELLEKSRLTVSEIAYTVGFNNPKNFSQYFKEEFNRIPSAYRSERRESQI